MALFYKFILLFYELIAFVFLRWGGGCKMPYSSFKDNLRYSF